MPISESDKILVDNARREERIEAMAIMRERQRLETYPSPCPTCAAVAGEPCMTRTGKRYGARHTTRYDPRV